jgi:hypothetical protein
VISHDFPVSTNIETQICSYKGPNHLWHSTGDLVFALQDAEEEDEGWQGWKDG